MGSISNTNPACSFQGRDKLSIQETQSTQYHSKVITLICWPSNLTVLMVQGPLYANGHTTWWVLTSYCSSRDGHRNDSGTACLTSPFDDNIICQARLHTLLTGWPLFWVTWNGDTAPPPLTGGQPWHHCTPACFCRRCLVTVLEQFVLGSPSESWIVTVILGHSWMTKLLLCLYPKLSGFV